MGSLQKAFVDQVSKVPQLALQKVLERKLREIGAELPRDAVAAFAEQILSGNMESFVWDDGGAGEKQHTLTFDKSDLEEVEEQVARLTETLPEIFENVSHRGAQLHFRTLRRNWEVQGAIEAYQNDEFRDRLAEYWGEGLGLLRMLLTVCREIGADACKRYSRSKSKKQQYRRFVLVRLQSRACQVSEEIITLMENGFADGAMARWRTLHEIATVATLIETGDEALAERYVLHDAVDAKREADEYERSQVPIGHAPIPKAYRKAIERDYAASISRFGDDFKGEYGWAAPRVKGRPTFKALQEEAGRANMGSHYKLASYNVHAGSRSLFHRLSGPRDEGVLMAGRSDSGLLEPGQNLAFTLVQITAAVTRRSTAIDGIIEQRAVLEIRDAIPKALAKADRKLRKLDAEFRKPATK